LYWVSKFYWFGQLSEPYLFRSGAPIYEIPRDSYTAEQILEILLSPVAEEKICRQQPMGITTSAKFVNLNSLKYPDDIKKDEFGKWKYTGSHNSVYVSWEDDNNLQVKYIPKHMDKNMFQLHKIYCKHPSNPQFQRLIAFLTDHKENPLHLCLVSYRVLCHQSPYMAILRAKGLSILC